jgi:ribosomal protein S18 acetylase RimI-like enzyme
MILGQAQQFTSPEEALEHFGVKGMKWGVRKERARSLQDVTKGQVIERTTKNGDTFTVSSNPPNKLNRALATISKNYAEAYAKGANLTIRDKGGKKIGDAMFDQKDNGDLYLNWVSIEKSARGRGYATEVMKAAAEHGKAMGAKRMTLEVPGNAPDARHIYEKMGFTLTGVTMGHRNDIWGGLTEMEYRFDD